MQDSKRASRGWVLGRLPGHYCSLYCLQFGPHPSVQRCHAHTKLIHCYIVSDAGTGGICSTAISDGRHSGSCSMRTVKEYGYEYSGAA